MMDANLKSFGVIAPFLAVTIGCGEKTESKIAPVSGVVTLDGRPVAGCTIVFDPISGGQPAFGTTDAAGNYTLSTGRHANGAVVGTHRVAVSLTQNPPLPTRSAPTIADPANSEVSGPLDAVAKPRKQVNIVPEKYGVLETSDLQAEVRPHANQIPFELKSK